jgi:hypothetical protein
MIYAKSILAGVLAVAAIAIPILAFAVSWWFLNGIIFSITSRQIMETGLASGLVALLIFVAGFRWKLRRLSHSK